MDAISFEIKCTFQNTLSVSHPLRERKTYFKVSTFRCRAPNSDCERADDCCAISQYYP